MMGLGNKSFFVLFFILLTQVGLFAAEKPNLVVRVQSYDKVFGFIKKSIDSSMPGVSSLIPMMINMHVGTKPGNMNFNGLDLAKPIYYKGLIDDAGRVKGALFLPVKDLALFQEGFMPNSDMLKLYHLKQVDEQVMVTLKSEGEKTHYHTWADQSSFKSEQLIDVRVSQAFVKKKVSELAMVIPFFAGMLGGEAAGKDVAELSNWLAMVANNIDEARLTLGVKNKEVELAVGLIPTANSSLAKELAKNKGEIQGLKGLWGSGSDLEFMSSLSAKSNQISTMVQVLKQNAGHTFSEKERDAFFGGIDGLVKSISPASFYSEGSIGERQRGTFVLHKEKFDQKEFEDYLNTVVSSLEDNSKTSADKALYKKFVYTKNKMKAEGVDIHHIHLQLNPDNLMLKDTSRNGKVNISQRADVYFASYGSYLFGTMNSVSKINGLVKRVKSGELNGQVPLVHGDVSVAYKLKNMMQFMPMQSSNAMAGLPKFTDEKLTFSVYSSKKLALSLKVPESGVSKAMGVLAQLMMSKGFK